MGSLSISNFILKRSYGEAEDNRTILKLTGKGIKTIRLSIDSGHPIFARGNLIKKQHIIWCKVDKGKMVLSQDGKHSNHRSNEGKASRN